MTLEKDIRWVYKEGEKIITERHRDRLRVKSGYIRRIVLRIFGRGGERQTNV